VVLKDLQRHPAKADIMHADFLRVSADHAINMHVPLHFINQEACLGVKAGGVVTHNLVEVEVRCLPADLPEYLEVDMANIELGQIVHLSDLQLPKGVELFQRVQNPDYDAPVATLATPRGALTDEEGTEEEAPEE
jgi:large subunit ribosomal protein L25